MPIDAAGLSPRLPLLVDQDSLLPSAWRLVGTMNAARPTTGAFLALQQLVARSFDATLTCLGLFCVFHPANEFIASKRRQALPQSKDFRIRSQGRLKVFACFVNGAMWKGVRHAISNHAASAGRRSR